MISDNYSKSNNKGKDNHPKNDIPDFSFVAHVNPSFGIHVKLVLSQKEPHRYSTISQLFGPYSLLQYLSLIHI